MRPVYNDELYHYGKTGMKWGKRVASNIKEGFKAQSQAQKDQILHPIHSTKAQLSMLKKNPVRTLVGGTKVLNELNADVAKRVANSKNTKKTAKEHAAAGAKHIGPALKAIGTQALSANRAHQNMKYSKMVFPD